MNVFLVMKCVAYSVSRGISRIWTWWVQVRNSTTTHSICRFQNILTFYLLSEFLNTYRESNTMLLGSYKLSSIANTRLCKVKVYITSILVQNLYYIVSKVPSTYDCLHSHSFHYKRSVGLFDIYLNCLSNSYLIHYILLCL